MEIKRFLGTVAPFDSLPPEILEALTTGARWARFSAGAAIIRAEEPGDAMYVIAEGRVQVRGPGPDPKILAWLNGREMFGEMALLTGAPRAADVVADADTLCVVLARAPLYRLMRQTPSVAQFLTELLGERLLEGGQISRVGKYQVLEAIGQGGVGTVFAGWHPELRRSVAIKMLNHEMVFDEQFARAFAAEAVIVARLEHPNIVRIFDYESAYATRFIVMEMLQGVTLGEHLRRRPRMGELEVRRVLLCLARALHHAHLRGITHRDVKPDNVMLEPGGGVKLMDFGIAGPIATRTDEEPIGTPEYMSPEQSRGEVLDARTDVYPLGVMAFEMLTGVLPFDHEDVFTLLEMKERHPLPDPRQWRPGLSTNMLSFIARACEPDPARRFLDCAAVAAFLGDGPEGSAAGTRSRTVRVRYPAEEEGAVRQALDGLVASLAPHGAVVTSEAPLSEAPLSGDEPPAPER